MPKREDSLLDYLSVEERKIYAGYEEKLKKTRDKAIRRHKAELSFWRQVDARADEVLQHIMDCKKNHQAQ